MPKSVRTMMNACVVALVVTLSAAATHAFPFGGSPPDKEPSLAPVVEGVLPAVVNISTVSTIQQAQHPLLRDPFFRRFFDVPNVPRERRASSLGSGVIVDGEEGYVLTNHHVVAEADEITITLKDGREFEAEKVGSDPEWDIALLQIDAENLTDIPFGDVDQLRVGDLVIAVGNPFGLGHTVTSGIVSALGRTGLGIEGYEDFIQTDASINPGNSGGALLDWQGKLVGINTAIMGPSGGNVGIGFAIPVDMIKGLMDQLIEHGEVQRGHLGVYIQDVTQELKEALDLESADGALISKVIEDSPADRAGLQDGDVVVALGGEPVTSSSDLRNRVGLMRPEQEVEVTYIRDGERHVTQVALDERGTVTAGNGSWEHEALPGAWLAPIPEDAPVDGVQVEKVEPGTAAARAGLRGGDLIDMIDRQDIADAESARDVLDDAGDRVLLRIVRGQGAIFLVVSR